MTDKEYEILKSMGVTDIDKTRKFNECFHCYVGAAENCDYIARCASDKNLTRDVDSPYAD